MARSHFTSDLFKFLKDLKRNNNREWFAKNKERYEEHVKEPSLRFIQDFDSELDKLSSAFVADSRPSGGSFFRIYRDTRFAKDKSPYKTHAGIQFRHMSAKDVHAPGFYLHLEPGDVFAGCGVWHPDAPALRKIRDAIVTKGATWKKATASPAFRKACPLAGDSLARPPKGYDPDHPLIVDLKRKDFITVSHFTEREVTAAGFLDKFAARCRLNVPFMRFLTEALELRW